MPTRETREGWGGPLLTIELRRMETHGVLMKKGSFLGWSVGLVLPLQKLLSCLGALVGPVQNIFFLAVDYFNSFVPVAKQGGQAAVLGRMSLSMCLWFPPWCHSTTKQQLSNCCGLPP